ncbi:choline dehydrogenase [soil metagenome]
MRAGDSATFDYVIVGGGTAGCILANRLSASGRHRVLMLEAGGEPRSPWIGIPAGFSKLLVDRRYNWRFQTEPEPGTNDRVIAVPRGKGLGGSSLINGMIYVRGQPGDYDAWERAGAIGWKWRSVEPYFRKVENYQQGGSSRGRDGPMKLTQVRERFAIADAFLRAAAEDGHVLNEDYNGERQDGMGYYQVAQHAGRRWSAYDGYLAPVRRRANLRVETEAQVLRLDLEGTRCTGVTYRKGGEEHTVRAGAEVILAAGAVQSPQLLELSGIGQRAVLARMGIAVRQVSEGVGENYIDHFATRMNWRIRNTVTLNEMSRGWRLALAVAEYFTRRTGILTLGTGLVHGFVKTRLSMPTPDGQFFFMHASYANAAERILDTLPGMTIGVTQLRPESVGSIHVKSLDPAASPAIRPNFLASEVDRQCMIESMKIVRSIAARPDLAPYIVSETSPGVDVHSDADWLDFARANGQTIYHPLGTCRMGEDAAAVVDSRLVFRGLSGLRVVDASVMPAMISGNIQAAVMMVAEKGADMVLADAVTGGS